MSVPATTLASGMPIDPGRAAVALHIGTDLAVQLQSCRRTAELLETACLRRQGYAPPPVSGSRGAASALLAGPPELLRRCTDIAGVVWHAETLRRLVLGRDLRPVVDLVGADTLAAVLARAPAAVVDGRPATHALAGAIQADGVRCRSAWCAAAGVDGVRLRLRLSAGDTPHPDPDPACAEGATGVRAEAFALAVRIATEIP